MSRRNTISREFFSTIAVVLVLGLWVVSRRLSKGEHHASV